MQVGAADQAAVKDLFIGCGAGKAANAAGPGQDRQLVEGIGRWQQRCDQGMAHLVIRDQALFGAVLQRPGTHAEGHPLECVVHGLLVNERAFTAGRENRRFVDQVGQIRS